MKSLVIALPQPQDRRKPPFRVSVSYYIKRYGLITLLIAVLFAGMAVGAMCAGSADDELLDKLNTVFLTNVENRGEQSAAQTFINSFGMSFLFMAALFCLSLSPLGLAAVPALMLFRGFGYGISAGYLCVTYGLKGLVYYVFVMLPGAFVSSLALVYAAQYCFDFSREIAVSIFSRSTENRNLRGRLAVLALNCSYMILMTVFASLLDAGLYYLIGGLFSF